MKARAFPPAYLLAIGGIVLLQSGALGQDFDTRLRQQQEELRRQVEENRLRMHEIQQQLQDNSSNQRGSGGQQTIPKQYVQGYGDSGSTPASQPTFTPPQSLQYTIPQVFQVSPSVQQPLVTPGSVAPLKFTQALDATRSKTAPLARAKWHDSRSTSATPVTAHKAGVGIDLDTMKEKPNPTIGAIMAQNCMRGAIIGGILGGILGLFLWLCLQGLRFVGVNPGKYTPICGVLAAVVVVAGATNKMSGLEDFAHKIPGFDALMQEAPQGKNAPIHFVAIKSDAFQFTALMPEPFSLERELIKRFWTTKILHQQEQGAFAFSYARLPSPEEMLRESNALYANANLSPGSISFDVERGLDGAAKSSVDFIHGTTINSGRLLLADKYPGRQIEGTLPNHAGLFRQRIYIFNGAYFQLLVMGKPDWTNSKDANKFLDSLKVNL
jgi:hypothetical protein